MIDSWGHHGIRYRKTKRECSRIESVENDLNTLTPAFYATTDDYLTNHPELLPTGVCPPAVITRSEAAPLSPDPDGGLIHPPGPGLPAGDLPVSYVFVCPARGLFQDLAVAGGVIDRHAPLKSSSPQGRGSSRRSGGTTVLPTKWPLEGNGIPRRYPGRDHPMLAPSRSRFATAQIIATCSCPTPRQPPCHRERKRCQHALSASRRSARRGDPGAQSPSEVPLAGYE